MNFQLGDSIFIGSRAEDYCAIDLTEGAEGKGILFHD